MVIELERLGWDVVGVDIKSGTDCRDVFRFDTGRYDLVVHLAAVVGGRMTIDREPMKVATDLAIDSDFFQYVTRTKPPRAVYFSSSAAYPVDLQDGSQFELHFGEQRGYRLRESDIDLLDVKEPDAIYGWVKLTGERLARHANADGAHVYVFRPFSGYGADQDKGYPFRDMIERTKIYHNVKLHHPGAQIKFEVWGDGEQVRDWVHIDDVIAAVIQTLEWDAHTIGPQNICTGVGTSAADLARLFMRTRGLEGDVAPQPDMPVGVRHRVGDPTLSHEIYKPVITVEEGVNRAVHA